MRMIRSPRRCALVVLAAMLLGIAAGATAALASGDCCAGMPAIQGHPDPTAPCHSVAPTSCCEAGTTGPRPTPPGVPALALPAEGRAPVRDRLAARACALAAERASASALASIVLRL